MEVDVSYDAQTNHLARTQQRRKVKACLGRLHCTFLQEWEHRQHAAESSCAARQDVAACRGVEHVEVLRRV